MQQTEFKRWSRAALAQYPAVVLDFSIQPPREALQAFQNVLGYDQAPAAIIHHD
jgi:predicted GNAT superfamily acetyltransferase